MARANRHHLPGYVWHITHRCHKKEFLLKFEKDKKRWISWLFEAKKRFGLCVLNYTVTSNHIHLLVYDRKDDVIPNLRKVLSTHQRLTVEYNVKEQDRVQRHHLRLCSSAEPEYKQIYRNLRLSEVPLPRKLHAVE